MSGGGPGGKGRWRRPTPRGCLVAALLAGLAGYGLYRLAISFGTAWSVSL